MGIFQEIFYRPIFNLVIGIYNILPVADFGLAIVTLTVLIKIIFLPLTLKTARSQKEMSAIAPELEQIKEKFKNDRTAQSAAIMQLYKSRNINPLSGCLPLLIQLPILIALYQAFLAGLNPEKLNLLYSFVNNPGNINNFFLGLFNITAKSPVMAVLAGLLQGVQAKLSSSNPSMQANKQMASLNKQMLYFFPVMIIIIGWNLPAGLMLYWITSTVFSIGEQWYIKSRV